MPTLAFNEFFYEFLRIFLIPENSLKFANFFCWGNEFSIYEGSILKTEWIVPVISSLEFLFKYNLLLINFSLFTVHNMHYLLNSVVQICHT